MENVPAIVVYLGLFVLLNRLWRLVDYLWFYFLRPATDRKFLHGTSPYVVITGSTDGIGKSLAKILYAKGFNLILHGRNEEKVKKAVEEIQALYGRKDGEIKYFVADASELGHDFESIARGYEDLNITLFINNVGGSALTYKTIDQRPENESRRIITLNLDFPLFLTRAFLPQLRRVSQSTGPVEVVFVGSVASELSPPFLWAYNGSKSFLRRAVGVLHGDERALHSSNLSFMYLNVGEVRSSSMTGDPSFFRPTAEEFAKGVVRSLGCGRRMVTPWYSHGILVGVTSLVPEPILERAVRWGLKRVAKDFKFLEGR